MDIFARVIKLKPGTQDLVRQWAETMNTRKAEALETLEEEGVEVESWFALTLDGQDFLVCYMRATSMAAAQAAAARSLHPINAIHQQFKVDTWVRGAGAVGTLLLDLDARTNGGRGSLPNFPGGAS